MQEEKEGNDASPAYIEELPNVRDPNAQSVLSIPSAFCSLLLPDRHRLFCSCGHYCWYFYFGDIACVVFLHFVLPRDLAHYYRISEGAQL